MVVVFGHDLNPQIYARDGINLVHNCDADFVKLDETTMDKQELLEYLDLNEHVVAEEVANAMQMSYSATAMALMRLVRQDLAARFRDSDSHRLRYQITPKGEARLDYFLEGEFDDG